MWGDEEMSRNDVSSTPHCGSDHGCKDEGGTTVLSWEGFPIHPQMYYFVHRDSRRLKGVNIIKIFNLQFGKYKLFLSLQGL